MSIYPLGIDSDATIARVDDDISEIGVEVINQNRAATFAIENELGIQPAGSAGSVASRLNVSLNPDGTIKASALTSIGLATLPVVDNQVAFNAGIKEYKLALDFSTSNLHTLILSNTALLNSLTSFTNTIFSDLNSHITGANLLADGSQARHVLSHIDLNSVPSDIRDPTYVWSGLKNKNGVARTAVTAAQALDQINTDLINHENSIAEAHIASAIIVDSSNFIEIPTTATDVQAAFNALDQFEVSNIGLHRATQHANAIPKIARSRDPRLPDGYRENVVPPTLVKTYLVHSPATSPTDDLSVGDDLIKFIPDNSSFIFDSQFSQVKIGDEIKVNYANGIETSFIVESTRYVPGTEWIVRINGTNICDIDGYALARIDRAVFDTNTAGILAVAAANPTPTGSFSSILSSVIVGNPRGAMALGLGFDPGKLDSDHYKLYLQLYPTGNPTEKVIDLPYIDVTGDAGISPGSYTLENIVQSTNDNFRQIGYNFRFIAFAHDGEFGIMLADVINNVSFSIVSGSNSSGTLSTGTYTQNVIGGSSVDDFDALGLGSLAANEAGPAYQATFADATAAQLPTKVIGPLKERNYYANGQRRDSFAPTYLSNGDGSWDGYISARNPIGTFTVETTYTINLNLNAAGLKPGKTIVVQPNIAFSNSLYNDVDYGRFVIKSINFNAPCGSLTGSTAITVINGIAGTGNGFGFSSSPSLSVKIYFSEDSVSFNNEEIIDQSPTTLQFHRLHEIYIDQNGNTFSHERGRMPRQVEDSSPSFLGTDRFSLKSISPKLRGYLDSNPLVFNKFVRLFILSYNSGTGEFDGYLGQRPSSSSLNILRTGPVITGRKNVPVKFYDETGIDYVEVKYNEITSPSSSILSTILPRFVDIELFPSLQLHDELLLLATCEVNWNPAANKDVVQYVTDTRQFGSIDENDFTNSALNFISAGDRLLHENGIISGLDFDSINSSDNREIYYKGGVALVNGKILTVNNISVVIPHIYTYGTSLPQTVTWAVCLNDKNELIPIVLTSSKQQFFATTDGISSFYLPSVTFAELIQQRKDLCPISLITAHIASFTISSSDILDIRRFIANGNIEAPLVLSSNQTTGNFHTFEAVKNWLLNFGNTSSLIKVKGNFTLSTQLDLSGFTFPIIFEGDGTNITVTASKGFKIGSNVTLKNLNFNYAPTATISYGSTDLVNSGNGCIYADATTSDINSVCIENCTFTESLSGSQRPPFINFVLEKGQALNNIIIRGNTFTDIGSTTNNAAIAIININTVGSGIPASVSNLTIENNNCSQFQGIYVTSKSAAASQARLGLNSFGSSIKYNSCGVIGVLTSQASNSSYLFANSMIVENNRCLLIGSLDGTGKHVKGYTNINYGTGNLNVKDNSCHWIHIQIKDLVASNELSTTKIIGNTLTAYDNSFLDSYYLPVGANITGDGDSVDAAISIYNFNGTTETNSVIISNNTINFGYYSTAKSYNIAGIWCVSSAIITDNIIKGLKDAVSAIGILLDSLDDSSTRHNHIVKGNQIYRNTATIAAFIKVNQATAFDTGQIVENNFDSPYIDAALTSTVTILNAPTTYVIERNINQTVTAYIMPQAGAVSINGFAWNASIPSTVLVSAVPGAISSSTVLMGFGIAIDATQETFTWTTYMSQIPRNTYVTQIVMPIFHNSDSAPDQTSNVTLTLVKSSGSVSSSVLNLITTTLSTTTNLTATPADNTYRVDGTLLCKCVVNLKSTDASFSNRGVALEALAVTYRW